MACDGAAGTGARPCTVGLTGGLASGKSTVARRLAERSVAVLDADRVVHELYRPGRAGAAAVRELFGAAVLGPDGAVDRAALAARVLVAAGDRRRLEAVIHPLVRARIEDWVAAQPAMTPVVVEAALLVETGAWRDYDVLVVVWCGGEQQLERAVGRGVAPERAQALLAAQLPLDEKRAVADVVVDNSGPPEALPAAVDGAWERIVALCRQRRAAREHGGG